MADRKCEPIKLSYATPIADPATTALLASALVLTFLFFGWVALLVTGHLVVSDEIALLVLLLTSGWSLALASVAYWRARAPAHPRRSLALGAIAASLAALLAAALAVPALNPNGHERSPSVRCASNLRQIGQGLLLYAMDYGGMYPPTLGLLITTEDIHADVFVCSKSSDTSAPGETSTTVPHSSIAKATPDMSGYSSPSKVVTWPAPFRTPSAPSRAW